MEVVFNLAALLTKLEMLWTGNSIDDISCTCPIFTYHLLVLSLIQLIHLTQFEHLYQNKQLNLE